MPLDEARRHVEEVLGFIGLAEYLDRYPRSSPAASAGAWRSAAPWRPSRSWCSSTPDDGPRPHHRQDGGPRGDQAAGPAAGHVDPGHARPERCVLHGGESRRAGRRPGRDLPADADRADDARFLVLKDGRIYFEGSAAELKASTDPYMKRYLTRRLSRLGLTGEREALEIRRRSGPGDARSLASVPESAMVGMERMPKRSANVGCASVSTFTTSTRPAVRCAIVASSGAIIRHGPHHCAQKSTTTGTDAFATSASNAAASRTSMGAAGDGNGALALAASRRPVERRVELAIDRATGRAGSAHATGVQGHTITVTRCLAHTAGVAGDLQLDGRGRDLSY